MSHDIVTESLSERRRQSSSIPLRTTVQGGLLTACAVVVGHALAGLPNVELVTLIMVLGGAQLGVIGGIGIASTTVIYFNYLNPLGPAIPLVALAQWSGWSFAAIVGSMTVHRELSPRRLAILGGTITVVFDVLTNGSYAYIVADGETAYTAFTASLIAGLPFMAIHVITNMFVFATLFPPLKAVLMKHRL